MTLDQISRIFGHYRVSFRRATDGNFTFYEPAIHVTSMGIEITFFVPNGSRVDETMDVKNIIRLYDVKEVTMVNSQSMTQTLYLV